MDLAVPILFEVIPITDSQNVREDALDVLWSGLPGALHVAPNEAFVAFITPGRRRLVLLSLESHPPEPLGRFQPNGSGVQLQACSWSADSEHLLVATSAGSVLVLDRSLQLQREFSSSSLGSGQVVALACCGGERCLVLTSDGHLKGLDMATGAQLFAENIQKLHKDPKALAFCLRTEMVLIASQRPTSPFVCISAWRYQDKQPSKLFQVNADYGPNSTLELPHIPPPAWSIGFSPLSEFAAISVSGHKVVVIDLEKKKEVEPFQKFGGKEVKTAAGLTYFARESVRNVASLSWWNNSCLGVSDIYGSVTLASLPGYVNILGTKPEQCTPGTVVAAVERLQQKSLLVLEPVVVTVPIDAATSRKARSRGSWKKNKGPSGDEAVQKLQGWKLLCYQERTPDEMVAVYLRRQDWDAAADVARTHQLDGDMIYQARWTIRPIDESNIMDNLAHMKDAKWVVEECLQRLATTAEAQRLLINTGLNRTEELAKAAYGLEDQVNEYYWAIMKRVELLQYKERLDTLLETLQGVYDPSAFESFRSLSLLDAGSVYAESGNLFALQQLLQRHTSVRLNVCQLLSALPETLEPHLFASLLPKADGSLPLLVEPSLQPDWVESFETIQILSFMGFSHLHQATETLAALQAAPAPTSEQIEEWYCQRALVIDERSGQLQLAVNLLELAQQRGVRGKVPLMQHLATSLLRAITPVSTSGDGSSVDAGSWMVSLQQFIHMTEAEQLALLLRNSSEASVAEDITSCVLPYMQGLLPDSQALLLEAVLEGNINHKLGWCVRLVDLECAQPMLYTDPTLLAKAVIRGLFSCKSSSQWSQLDAMVDSVLHCLNAALYREDGEAVQELIQQCTVLKGGIRAAQLLTKQGLVMTVAEVSNADHQACVKAVQQLLARAVRGGRQRGEKEWQQLWKDLHAAQSAGLPNITREEILELFVRSLLSAGRFHLASGYLQGSDGVELPASKAEELVVKEALHFLYSASSLEDDNITIARRCLDLVPEAQAGKQLAATIQAILDLPHWGVTLLPIQLSQLPDKLQVVDMVLVAKPTACGQLPALLRLASMLGIEEGDPMQQVKLKVAAAALKTGAVDVAASIAQQIAEAAYAPGWELCAALGRDARAPDLEQRRALLGFALTACPDKFLGQLVADLKALNSETGAHSLPIPLPPQHSILHPGCHSSVSSDLPITTLDLLFLPGDEEAADILVSLEAQCAGEFSQLQRVLMMGVYVHALRSLSVVYGGIISKDSLTQAQKLLQLPLAELVKEAQARSPAARSTYHMQQFCDKLGAARNKRKLQQLLPHLDTSKDDAASQRESTLQLASLAGQVALQTDEGASSTSDVSANGEVHESHEAQKLLHQAHALATQCGVRPWEVKMTYVQSLVVAAKDPVSSKVQDVLNLHKPELLRQPTEMLTSLYMQLYPLLPATSSPHMACTVSLMIDAIKALPQAHSSTAAFAILPCLDKLKVRLQRIPPTLSSLSWRLVVAGLVNGLMQIVLGTEVVKPLDETYSLEAFAAVYALTQRDNAEQLAAVLKDFRNIAALAMKVAESHQLADRIPLTITRHLSPSLPSLCMACKLLCTHTPPNRTSGDNAAAAAALEACQPLWSLMGPKHLGLAASFFVRVSGRQPLREEAVGKLYPIELGQSQKLQLLQAVLPVMHGAGSSAPDVRVLAPLQQLQRQLAAAQALLDVDTLTQAQLDAADSILLEGPVSSALPSCLQHLLVTACPAHAVHDVCSALWELWQEDVKHAEGSQAAGSAYRATSPSDLLSGMLQSTLTQQLHDMVEGMRGGGMEASSAAIVHVEGIISSLDGEPDSASLPGPALSALRDLVWEKLQLSCSSLEAAHLQQTAGQKLLDLQSELAAGRRWQGWQLPEGQQSRLLHARTKALLADQWPDVQVREQDVSSCDAAEGFFNLMLAASTKPRQLQLLSQLMEEVWVSGRVWQTPQPSTTHGDEADNSTPEAAASCPEAANSTPETGASTCPEAGSSVEACEVYVEPLHDCWRELMVSMLQDQLAGDVLRLLDKRATHLHSGHSLVRHVLDPKHATHPAADSAAGAVVGTRNASVAWVMDEEEYSSVIAEGDLSVSPVVGVCLGLLSPFTSQVQQALQDLERMALEDVQVDSQLVTLLIARGVLAKAMGDSTRFPVLCKFLVGSVHGTTGMDLGAGGSLSRSGSRTQGGSTQGGSMSGMESISRRTSGAHVSNRATGYDVLGMESILALCVLCVLCVEGKLGEGLGLLVQLTRLHGALATYDGAMAVLNKYLSAYGQRDLAAVAVQGAGQSTLPQVWSGVMGVLPRLLSDAIQAGNAGVS